MAFNFRRFFNGINIVPKTTSTVSVAGDLDFNTTNNKATLHDGTVSSPLVTEASTATLTNKTLTSPAINTPTITGSGGTLTLPAGPDTLVGQSTSATLTNKTIAAGSNTVTGLTNTNLSGSAAVSNANLATMPTLTVKGNNTGGSATPSDLTVSQVNSLLGSTTTVGAFDGQTASANALTIASGSLYAQSASATNPGDVNTTTQTFAGNKTFNGSIIASGGLNMNNTNISGANSILPNGGGTLTLPAVTDTLVGKTTTDTLSNKTLQKLVEVVVTDSATTGTAQTLPSGDINSGVVRLTNASLVSIAGITAGTSGQVLTVQNQTGVTLTILDTSGSASAGNQIKTGTAATITMPANSTFTFVYDTTAAFWMLQSGSSLGGLTAWTASTPYAVGAVVTYEKAAYVCLTANTSSSTFEVDVAASKWVLLNTPQVAENLMLVGNNFEDGDAGGWTGTGIATLTNGLPVTVGSGGAAFSSSNGGRSLGANTTAPAVTSSSPINGTYSLNLATSGAGTIGDGYISQVYPISSKYQAKVLTVQISYKVVSGSPNLSGTSSNTYAAAVYDVVNNAWLPVVGAFNFVQSTGVGTFTGTVQTASNSTGLQLFVYSPVAPTGASSLLIDDCYIGPQVVQKGPAMSDLVSYTPSNSQGFGTLSAVNLQWKRNGDCLQIIGGFTSGTITGSVAQIGLPAGLTIGGISGQKMQVGNLTRAGSGGPITVMATQGNTFVTFGGGASSQGDVIGSSLVNSSEALVFSSVIIPIVGWSSNSNQSSDTDTRVISFSGTQASQAVTGATTNITFTSTLDRAGAWSTNQYTVPVSGDYLVSGGFISTVAGTAFDVYLNGSHYGYTGACYTAGASGGGSVLVTNCKANDLITVRSTQTATISSANLSIFRLSGPAVITATESVNARYYGATATITGADSAVTFTTKDYDSHNAYSGSTYTIPVSGKYQVNAQINMSITVVAGQLAGEISIFKNGSIYSDQRVYAGGAMGNVSPIVSDIVNCKAGDTVVIQAASGGTSPTINASNSINYFSIARVGN